MSRTRGARGTALERGSPLMRVAIFCLALCVGIVGQAAARPAIWIDTDPSIGAPYREVDDGFALITAFHSPELRIVGLSTTFGNAGLKRTTAVTRNLVRRFGASAAVSESAIYPGATSARSLGIKTSATQALATALRKERLTYLALGPVTNLGSFLQLHPELSDRIERVIFVGGRTPGRRLAFGPSKALEIHDANVFKDPAAARVLLEAKIPLVLAPPEVGGELLLTRDDARQLSTGGSAAQFLQRNSRVWLWFWTTLVRHRGGPLFDSLAIVIAALPEVVRMETRYAGVRPSGELVARDRPFAGARPVQFSTAIRPDASRLMLERMRSEPTPPVTGR